MGESRSRLYSEKDYLRQAEEDWRGQKACNETDDEGESGGESDAVLVPVTPPKGRGPTRYVVLVGGKPHPPSYEDEGAARRAVCDIIVLEGEYLHLAEESLVHVYDAGEGVVVVKVTPAHGRGRTRYVVLVDGRARPPSHPDPAAARRVADRIAARRMHGPEATGGGGGPRI